MKIFIDAGHGPETAGKRSPNGMKEYEFNSTVALLLKEKLENYQHTSIQFGHSDGQDIPLAVRTARANRWKADIYLSIHANAFGSSWSEVNGIETYIYSSRPKKAEQLAIAVQQQLILATGRKNRGVKTANFQVLRQTNMPAILVEAGFMTNREEEKLLRSRSYRELCATAIEQGLVLRLRLVKKSEARSYF